MKILMLNYEFPPLGGGASPVTYNLAKELVSQGHEVDVVTMHYRELKKEEVIDGIHVYRVACLRSKREICYTREMLTYVISATLFTLSLTKRKEYDITHCHFIIPTGIIGYLLKKVRGLPYIITSHGSDVQGYNPERFLLQHRIVKPVWKVIVKDAGRIIAVSSYFKGLILKNIVTDNISVIHNGQSIMPQVSVKKEQKILLVSRILKRKGFQDFLDAVDGFDLKGWEVNIAGDGPYLGELIKKSEDLGLQINFLGFKTGTELDELYQTSSVFVFPSTHESFGMVLTEAMAAGCAIITTNVSGCEEVIGDAGFLVSPECPEDIKEALVELIGDQQLRDRLGERARERVKRFSWEHIAQKYIKTYEEVIKGNGNRRI